MRLAQFQLTISSFGSHGDNKNASCGAISEAGWRSAAVKVDVLYKRRIHLFFA
jgi:hypothetical protein